MVEKEKRDGGNSGDAGFQIQTWSNVKCSEIWELTGHESKFFAPVLAGLWRNWGMVFSGGGEGWISATSLINAIVKTDKH